MTDAALIWSYLSRDPLVWLAATLAAYWIGDRLSLAVGRKPWANPVLIAVLLLAVLLVGTGTPYRAYFEGAQFVHFLLGPATVSLAVPLWRNAPLLKRAALPVLAALVAGSVTAIVVALAVAAAFGVDDVLLATVAAKSATAPVAIGVAEFTYASGKEAVIKCGGILKIEAGGTITPNAELVSDGSGKVVARGTTATTLYNVIGRALTDAADGELVMVRWGPYSTWGDNAS